MQPAGKEILFPLAPLLSPGQILPPGRLTLAFSVRLPRWEPAPALPARPCQLSQEAKPPACAEPTECKGGAWLWTPRCYAKVALGSRRGSFQEGPPPLSFASLAGLEGNIPHPQELRVAWQPQATQPKVSGFLKPPKCPPPEIKVRTSVTTMYVYSKLVSTGFSVYFCRLHKAMVISIQLHTRACTHHVQLHLCTHTYLSRIKHAQ